jgi:hypothetical protein
MTSKIISKAILHEAKWTALKEITYSDPNGVERVTTTTYFNFYNYTILLIFFIYYLYYVGR